MKVVNKNHGFTLIEMIIVIVIIGLLSGVLFMILQGPMRAFADVERRSRLVDIGDTALQRMTREIRLALPNSIRISGGTAVEFLRTLDGGRYRAQGANRLKFNKSSDTFEFLGPLNNFAAINTGTTRNDCLTDTANSNCLVVYNTQQPGADAYAGDNIAVITAKNGGASTLGFDISPEAGFPFPSPRQRFFVVDTPVSYICSGNRIVRYSNYAITAGQAVPPPGGSPSLLIDQLAGCSMDYDPGTATRAGLVTIRITIQDTQLGESITLLQQAHVDNQP